MSDIVDTINRLEAWVRNYGHEKQPAFIADLKVLIGAAKAALQVAATLENAERIMIMHEDDEIESYAVPSQDVDGAIDTLRAGGDE
ncbi:MAG: hypothetical protein ACK6EB_11060 [Planctomyces sp.]